MTASSGVPRVRIVIAAMLLVACTGAEDHKRAPESILVPTRLTTLEESDSAYLAQPTAFVVEPNGDFLIGDSFNGHVLEFSRDGRFVARFGKLGSGPGELRSVTFIMPLSDSIVAVGDDRLERLTLLQVPSGRYVRQIDYSGPLRSGVADGDELWLGILNLADSAGVAHGTLVADTLAYLVPVPAEYLKSSPLAGISDLVNVVKWEDTLAIGYSGTNTILFADTTGAVFDSVRIPIAHRRGVPADVVLQLSPQMPFPQMFSLTSILFKLARLPDGRFAAVHYDSKIDGHLITTKVYVSLLSAGRDSACVDVVLPTSQDALPLIAVRGDSLYLLEQHVVGSAATATIRSFRFAYQPECRWVALRGG